MRVCYLVKTWYHHSPSAGYAQLAFQSGACVISRRRENRALHFLARNLLVNLSETGNRLIDYRVEDAISEWRTIARSMTTHLDVVHVLNGDEQLNVLVRHRAWLRSALVATFHVPEHILSPEGVEYRSELARTVDIAVVVARSQLPEFQRWFGSKRVRYVPHGIDTAKFTPGGIFPLRAVRRVIVVGSHMRDWTTIHRVIDACNARNLPVSFDVVSDAFGRAHLCGCDGTTLHAGIGEEELIALYQNADVLLCPVTDATANNAILESMACGTPVISTLVGGIPDYVDSSCGWLFEKGDAFSIIHLISALCDNPDVGLSRRRAARDKACAFDWSVIKRQMAEVYESAIVLKRHGRLERKAARPFAEDI